MPNEEQLAPMMSFQYLVRSGQWRWSDPPPVHLVAWTPYETQNSSGIIIADRDDVKWCIKITVTFETTRCSPDFRSICLLGVESEAAPTRRHHNPATPACCYSWQQAANVEARQRHRHMVWPDGSQAKIPVPATLLGPKAEKLMVDTRGSQQSEGASIAVGTIWPVAEIKRSQRQEKGDCQRTNHSSLPRSPLSMKRRHQRNK